MNEFPIIEKDDLILRKLELTDYDNYYDYVTDDAISKQFLFDYDRESCYKRLEELIQKYSSEEDESLVWAIALKSTNEMIGIITLYPISFANKNCEIGYGIRKKHRSKNYAYKASYALINYIFNNWDMHRFQIAHNIDNIASQKTIEKLGAKLEGIARESKFYNNGFVDRKIYSILKSEWIAMKNETC